MNSHQNVESVELRLKNDRKLRHRRLGLGKDRFSLCLFAVRSDPGCFTLGDQLKQTLVRGDLLLCEGQTRLSTSDLHVGVGRLGDD